jgi:hypothetical protein
LAVNVCLCAVEHRYEGCEWRDDKQIMDVAYLIMYNDQKQIPRMRNMEIRKHNHIAQSLKRTGTG